MDKRSIKKGFVDTNLTLTDSFLKKYIILLWFGGSSLQIYLCRMKKALLPANFKSGQTVQLSSRQIQLYDVIITSEARNPCKAFSETGVKMRGVSNSKEVLRMVPGLFIGQHQGGGKAE